MTRLVNLSVEYGHVQFNSGRRVISASSTNDLKVSPHTSTQLETDPYYEVTFTINAEFINKGKKFNNTLNWTCILSDHSEDETYRTIESASVILIPSMLRSISDKIDEIYSQNK